ncbi:N-alpha-acetyltransferase 60 [Nymphon striatum]|nr:N-alpha-acetyltransferase 60 [Nymphon striatum]
MTKKVLLSGDNKLQLRFLCPNDFNEVKKLCSEIFPIEYPDCWYREITTNSKFYSLAAVYNLQIVGLIVSEMKPWKKCNNEDKDILCSRFLNTASVAYILTLGVDRDYRRNGIASLLLDNLIAYVVSNPDTTNCKALYLHALTSNIAAIQFYEQKKFKPHCHLPCYYWINGKPVDGFSYVLYVNDGFPPRTFLYPFLTYLNKFLIIIKRYHQELMF